MKDKIIYLVLICSISFSSVAVAQTNLHVKGRVTDIKGEPVIGAVVQVEGASGIGTATDADGNYVIDVPYSVEAKSLKTSCIGYKSVVKVISSVVDFVLEEDKLEIEEVVFVGYGSMRKSDLTGSLSSVKIDDIVAAQSSSLDQLIQGNAAGVQVMNSTGSIDGGVSIRVRGTSSFSAGASEPLYVVDGIIINASGSSETIFKNAGLDMEGAEEDVNGLLGINPQDIENIEILKDASATAIYGALGANGVVLITTKTAKSEKPIIRFQGGCDVSKMSKAIPVMNFDDYVKYRVDTGQETLDKYYSDPEGRTGLKVTPMNWQEYITRPAFAQRYSISISGRPNDYSYLFSLGFNNRQGIVKETDSNQLMMRLNLDKTIGKRLTIGTKSSVSYTDSHLFQGLTSTRLSAQSSLMRSAVISRPYLSSVDDDLSDDDVKGRPDRWLSDSQNLRQEVRITPSLFLDLKILPWLSFKTTNGADIRSGEITKFRSSRVNSQPTGSVGARNSRNTVTFNSDNVFTAMSRFGKHNITGTAGVTAMYSSTSSSILEGWNITEWKAMSDNLNGALNKDYRYAETSTSTLSFFTRGVYSYADRYVLTATFRADGSSKFLGRNKWAYFPSFAFAWRVSEEPWFLSPSISSLKVRAGWGRVGNQTSPAFRTLDVYSLNAYGDHNPDNKAQSSLGLYPSYIANPDLRWETSEQFNFGLDFSMWQGRMTLTVDGYYKKTYDLLQEESLPFSSGFKSMFVNRGTIRNAGIEFSFEAIPLKIGSFEWSLSGNFSVNKNKILNVGNSSSELIYLNRYEKQMCNYFYGDKIGSNIAQYPANIFIEGQEMGLFYGLLTDGIVQEGEEPGPGFSQGAKMDAGSIRYVDLNSDGKIGVEDRTIIGNPNPDILYAFKTNFKYKRWNLSVDFSGVHGNDILNVLNISLKSFDDIASSSSNKLRDAYYECWSPTNKSSEYPAWAKTTSPETQFITDRSIEDGSYLKLSSARLSYSFKFKKEAAVKGLTLALSGNNLFYITKYSGWNPEVNSFAANVKKVGIDAGSYPSAMTCCFDLSLTF